MQNRRLSLVIDTETTGVNPALDRICELAVVLTDWHVVHAVLHSYVNPGFVFENPKNGLTDKDVRDAPSFRELCGLGFYGLLSLPDEYIAHNIAFDLRFLTVELRHLGLDLPNRQVRDTFKITKARLDESCRKFKVNTSDISWHSALGDCVATFRLAQKLAFMQDGEDIDNSASGGFAVRTE